MTKLGEVVWRLWIPVLQKQVSFTFFCFISEEGVNQQTEERRHERESPPAKTKKQHSWEERRLR